MNTHDPIPARLAALKTMKTPELKAQWRELFDSEPPPFNRRYLESRLAYRIQELAYGGLKPETVKRLERLGEELDGGDRKKSRVRADLTPIAGTRLIREWQGVEHVVTVTADGFEWQGRPYKSLSAIARAITSWRTSASISRILSTLKDAWLRIVLSASSGTRPNLWLASVAAISTSSQLWNFAWSVQMAPISGRV